MSLVINSDNIFLFFTASETPIKHKPGRCIFRIVGRNHDQTHFRRKECSMIAFTFHLAPKNVNISEQIDHSRIHICLKSSTDLGMPICMTNNQCVPKDADSVLQSIDKGGQNSMLKKQNSIRSIYHYSDDTRCSMKDELHPYSCKGMSIRHLKEHGNRWYNSK